MDEMFQKLTMSIYNVWHVVRRVEREEVERLNMKHGLAHVLLVIDRHPEGLTATQLCTLCDKDKAAISRIVADLVESGLVIRNANRGNHYRAKLTLTEQGKAVAKQVEVTAYWAVEKAVEGLDSQQTEQLLRIFDRIALNLEKICTDGLEK